MNDSQKEAFWKHSLKMRKYWYPAFFPFFTMFSTPFRDQSHSLIHILFVLCRRFRLMSLKFYCLVIHISHKTLEIGCAWSKGSGERLQGHHGPLVDKVENIVGKEQNDVYYFLLFTTTISNVLFLSHLSTTCWRWGIVIGLSPVASNQHFLIFPKCFLSNEG